MGRVRSLPQGGVREAHRPLHREDGGLSLPPAPPAPPPAPRGPHPAPPRTPGPRAARPAPPPRAAAFLLAARPAPPPRAAAFLLAAAGLLAACRTEPTGVEPPNHPTAAPSAPAPAPAPPRREPATVTILYTTDEHGWLFGQGDGDKLRGGAAEALAHWMTDDAHCPLRAPDPAAGGPCRDPATLLLSGGDNFTGPAVSSFFRGAPMARAMARMGYVASAFGNHEYDFDRAAFDTNRAEAGVAYLAANVRVLDPAKDPALPAFVLVERRGMKIGVVGVATEDTPREALPSRFDGLAFDPPEPALDRAITDVYGRGADAVVVLAHACEDEIAPVVERHPEWRLAFVGLGHCHRRWHRDIAGTPVVMPGWRLDAYARVQIAIDPARAPRERVTSTSAEVVNVRPHDGLAPDAAVAALRDAAKTELDAALGANIGYSASGMDDDSEAMGRWITRAVRDELHVDAALTNWSGLRESLPRGPVTKASVHSILPFENTVYVLQVSGAVLGRVLGERAFVVSGARRVEIGKKRTKGGGERAVHEVRLDGGAVVDPAKTYTLAVSDFLYEVGKDFDFKAADPSPRRTGIDFRAPVIAWTLKVASTEKSPLEKKVGGSTKPPPRKKKPNKNKQK